MNCYQFIQGYGKRCFVDRFWDTNTGYEIRRIRDTDTIRWKKNPKKSKTHALGGITRATRSQAQEQRCGPQRRGVLCHCGMALLLLGRSSPSSHRRSPLRRFQSHASALRPPSLPLSLPPPLLPVDSLGRPGPWAWQHQSHLLRLRLRHARRWMRSSPSRRNSSSRGRQARERSPMCGPANGVIMASQHRASQSSATTSLALALTSRSAPALPRLS